MNQFYAIKGNPNFLRWSKEMFGADADNRILLFKYPVQAFQMIEKRFGGSKYLKVVKWRERK